VGPRAGLDVCEKSRLHQDSIPDRPSRSQSVRININIKLKFDQKGSEAEIAQSVKRLATGWKVWGSIPVEARFSATVQTDPGAHPASYKMSTGPLSRG
jgi:hypothetical protein